MLATTDAFFDELSTKVRRATQDYEEARALLERAKRLDDRIAKKVAKNAIQLASDAVDDFKIARAQTCWNEKSRKFAAAGTASHQACLEDIGKLKKALNPP